MARGAAPSSGGGKDSTRRGGTSERTRKPSRIMGQVRPDSRVSGSVRTSRDRTNRLFDTWKPGGSMACMGLPPCGSFRPLQERLFSTVTGAISSGKCASKIKRLAGFETRLRGRNGQRDDRCRLHNSRQRTKTLRHCGKQPVQLGANTPTTARLQLQFRCGKKRCIN